MPRSHAVGTHIRASVGGDYFDRTLDAYFQLPGYAMWRAIELRLLSRYAFERPTLDLGCGDGSFVTLLDRGPFDAGCDIDPLALPVAARSGAYRTVHMADAGHLPYRTGVFRTLLSNCVMEHIPHYEQVIREIGRVVAPGGQVLLTVPSRRFHDYLCVVRRHRHRGRPERAAAYAAEIDRRLAHHYYLDPEEWAGRLRAASVDVEEVTWYLPQAALGTWNVLEEILTRPVLFGRPLYGALASPRRPVLRAVNRAIVKAVLGGRLRRLYLTDAAPGEGAAFCLAARRRQDPR
jgi:SAM-dependent methyltransferase